MCREEERKGNECLAEKSGPRLAVLARPCTALVMSPSRERRSFPKCEPLFSIRSHEWILNAGEASWSGKAAMAEEPTLSFFWENRFPFVIGEGSYRSVPCGTL
jgi:hypothetical protein